MERRKQSAFWGRTILGTALLLISLLFQFGVVAIDVPEVQLRLPSDPRWFYICINILSWFLWIFLTFKFVDLLRHRVPEEMESEFHNNLLPNPLYALKIPPRHLDLKSIGRVFT